MSEDTLDNLIKLNSGCEIVSDDKKENKEKYNKTLDIENGYGWGILGVIIVFFIVFVVIFWLVFYSLKPSFVIDENTGEANTGKVLLASIVVSLIIIIIGCLIYFTMYNKD